MKRNPTKPLDSDDKAAYDAAVARVQGKPVQLQFNPATMEAKTVPATPTAHDATLIALRNARAQIKVLGSATDAVNQAHLAELDAAIARLTKPGGNAFDVLADSISANAKRLVENVAVHRRSLAGIVAAIDTAIAEGDLAKMVHAVKVYDPVLAAQLHQADDQLKLIASLKKS